MIKPLCFFSQHVFQEIHSSNIWSLASVQVCSCGRRLCKRKQVPWGFLCFKTLRKQSESSCDHFQIEISVLIHERSSICLKSSFERREVLRALKRQQFTGRKWTPSQNEGNRFPAYGPAELKYDSHYGFIKHSSAVACEDLRRAWNFTAENTFTFRSSCVCAQMIIIAAFWLINAGNTFV